MRHIIYSHDTYGLGHIRRSMRIARAIVSADRDAHVLIATGSPQAGSFRLPEGVDIVRLPAVTKDNSGAYRSRTLGVPLAHTVGVRSAIFSAAVEAFRPDCLLVDHAPAGLNGEILPVLTGRSRPDRVVLGLRDIIDDPMSVAANWSRNGIWDLIADYYDEIAVYGDESVCTTARELCIEHRVNLPVDHVGYVATPPMHVAEARSDLPHILVTAGGGGDGAPVLERFVDYLAEVRPNVRATVVTGPLLSQRRRERIARQVEVLENVAIHSFIPKMERLIAHADGVISMAGYNSVAELLSAGTPAFLFPRTHPRLEQWIRANRLRPHAPFDIGTAATVESDEFDRWIERCRIHVRQPTRLSTQGALRLAERLTGSLSPQARALAGAVS